MQAQLLRNRMSQASIANRRGTALFAAVIATMVMVALSMAWMSTSMARSSAASANLQKIRVNQMAEAGLNAAIADLIAGGDGILGVDRAWDVADDTGGIGPRRSTIGAGDGLPTFGEPLVSLVSFGGGDGGFYTYTEPASSDGVSFHIWASAFQNGVTSSVEAVVSKFDLPPMVGAVYLQYPDLSLAFNGNAFTINGNDKKWDDTAGAKAPLPGVATPWDTTSVALTIPAARQDQVLGEGGEPSVGAAPYIDIHEVAEELEPFADNYLPGGTYTGGWGDKDTGDFPITYIDGDFHQSGSATGAGILIVDGDFRLSGSFVWYGAIYVLGKVEVVGGGGTKHIYGSVYVGDDVVEIGTSEFTIAGTSDIDYSSESEDALKRIPIYRLSYWAQLR